MSAMDSSANGGTPLGRLPNAGFLRTSARPAVPSRGRDATIDALTLAVGRLRRGGVALKTENRLLRAEIAELKSAEPSRLSADAPIDEFGRLAEIALPTGSGAPAAARMVIGHCLAGLVSQRILPDVELLTSELVTNCLKHAELRDDDSIVLRVYLAAGTLRLEIENPGTAGEVASRPRGRRPRRDGFGLELVGRLAARWGVKRADGTNVWFEMART
jgi:anti-sigma regulatory factor (Ser/Thr protein kinase)